MHLRQRGFPYSILLYYQNADVVVVDGSIIARFVDETLPKYCQLGTNDYLQQEMYDRHHRVLCRSSKLLIADVHSPVIRLEI